MQLLRKLKLNIKNFKKRFKNLALNFLLDSSPLFFEIASNYIKHKSLQKTYKILIEENINHNKVFTAKDLLNLIRNSAKQKDTCHIICSGSTAIDTIKNIKKSDYIMGCNYSCLLFAKPDIHFLEYSKTKTERDKILSKILAKSVTDIGSGKLIWKGISNSQLSFESIKRLFIDEGSYLIDYSLLPFVRNKEKRTHKCVKKLFNAPYKIGVPQYANSLVTLVGIASKVFKKIVIHGCDMGGPRFYEHADFNKPDYLSNKEFEELKDYGRTGWTSNELFDRYGAEADLISLNSLKVIMPFAIQLSRNKGIEISYAC